MNDDPRVVFAAERTLLAWTRTSLSFIGFGFIIERSGLLLEAFQLQNQHKAQWLFWLGVMFICVGTVITIASTIHYKSLLKNLYASSEIQPSPMLGLMNYGLAGLGICLTLLLVMDNFL